MDNVIAREFTRTSRPGSRSRSAAPARQQSQRSWANTLLPGIFLCLLLWGAWLLSQPGTLPIKYVRITGDFRHLQPEQLQTLVSSEVRGGFFNVNVGTIRDILLRDPWIEDVMVQRVWPETLRVLVTEHVPLARWGADSLLNTRGERFTPDQDSIPPTLPVLRGPDGSEPVLLRRFRELSQRLQPLGLQITELEQDPRRSWRFVVNAGFSVVLGRKEFAQRIDRFAQTVPQALRGRIGQVDEIDMRYTNGFSVRWKQTNSDQSWGT
ncbi:MAG: cell division protein FtsQ/DivIB [Thiotrichales bacterium]|nr:cell division protein FtsQ/DivIB [Thiotrichales bacterium]